MFAFYIFPNYNSVGLGQLFVDKDGWGALDNVGSMDNNLDNCDSMVQPTLFQNNHGTELKMRLDLLLME
jgi:hypothetical protein